MSISPYSGHTFHESPIFLHFYKFLITNYSEMIDKLFVLVDVLTAVLLSLVCYKQLNYLSVLEEQRMKKNVKKEDISRLSIDRTQITERSLRVAIIYLLSPYSVLSCVGQSTSVFTNFLMALTLLTTTMGLRVVSAALLALLAIFLITDLLFAFVKREFYISHGVKTEPDGKLSRLELAF
ncbi:unnamed protein product [Medioppia subpectinata]|uniref:Uncharacterized protein n=1 Tax=Medioppia subpectinata TaxID=1979941 RepID=A0A7R9Q2S0_9ACAR|nr:unnamed protein product [Medioppia subpectinata]CAG2110507.1 unnamed protein product [Medioppia subpectinata]